MRKKLMTLAAVLCCTMLTLTSCSEEETPVTPSAVDNGAWTIDGAKDTNVKPGDDFYQYCNGTWIANATYDASINANVTGFYYTELNTLGAKRKTPEQEVNSTKFGRDLSMAAGQNVEQTEAILQQAVDVLNAATTREQLWEAMAQLTLQGYQMPLSIMALPKTGRICGVVLSNGYQFNAPVFPPASARQKDWLRDTEAVRRLKPITSQGTTRGAVTSEWPMLVKMCEVLGLNPADVYLSPDDFSFSQGKGAGAEEALKQIQALEPDQLRAFLLGYIDNDRRLYGDNVMTDVLLTLMSGPLAACNNYDTSARYAKANVTQSMCQRGSELCEQLRKTFKKRIADNRWLSEPSKAQAQKKLDAMTFFVGMPDEFFEEGMYDLSQKQTLLEDVMEMRKAYFGLQRRLLGLPVSKGAFHIVLSIYCDLSASNAFYLPICNSLFILPVWLMSPIYEDGANSAYNFATVCSVIGHEMTHGFDTAGCLYDEYGDVGSLWASDTDAQSFAQRADALKNYYSSFEVAPGVYANGEKTISEDIADLGGVEIAFQAYTDYLTSSGFWGDELVRQQRRFFESYGYFWRAKYTDDFVRQQVANKDDLHSLARERVNGVVTNIDSWYDLFGVRSGDKLYRTPEQRVHIW